MCLSHLFEDSIEQTETQKRLSRLLDIADRLVKAGSFARANEILGDVVKELEKL